MTSNAAALAATIILLFPMGYFFLASPAFLLVRLDIPQLAQLLRGMFNVQFVMMSIAGVIATLTYALAGHPAFAIAIGLVAAFAIFGRRGFLRQWDAQQSAKDAGDASRVNVTTLPYRPEIDDKARVEPIPLYRPGEDRGMEPLADKRPPKASGRSMSGNMAR